MSRRAVRWALRCTLPAGAANAATAWRVLVAMADAADDRGRVELSTATIAAHLGTSRRSVQRGMTLLERVDLVRPAPGRDRWSLAMPAVVAPTPMLSDYPTGPPPVAEVPRGRS